MRVDWTLDVPSLLTTASLVLVVIIFIIQQNDMKKHLMVQNFSEYTRRYHSIVMALPSNITDEEFKLSDLSECEKERTMRLMRAYFDLCAEEYLLFRKRLLDREVWADWKRGMTYTMNRPAFKEAWGRLSRNEDLYESFRLLARNELLRR